MWRLGSQGLFGASGDYRGDVLNITHDVLARDAGTAREVVTRILKQFQNDGLVKLTRGKIEVLDAPGLGKI